jgi:hypothetical protein
VFIDAAVAVYKFVQVRLFSVFFRRHEITIVGPGPIIQTLSD